MSKSGIDTRSGIEEALEQQVPKRNGSRSVMVSAQATTEPAPEPRPGPTGMPLLLRPLDEVGDDQEIAGETHLDDDAELELQPIEIGLARIALDARAPRSAAPARRAPSRAARRLRSAPSAKAGRIGLRAGGMKAQRWAITSVLSTASGRSRNSSRISRADLKRCSCVTRRRSGCRHRSPARCTAARRAPRYMPSSLKNTSLVATSGRSVA